jgi:regulator of cell morphogenesis and NO signaling
MTINTLPENPGELTQFIETHYHAKHRTQLPALVALAEKVEAVHQDDAHVPAGLAALLRKMSGELEVHMKKEELILFPAMRNTLSGLDAPITAMRQDHDDHSDELATIKHLTNNLTLPQGACGSWTRLYSDLSDFVSDLEEHIRLENDVLFPHFEKLVGSNA